MSLTLEKIQIETATGTIDTWVSKDVEVPDTSAGKKVTITGNLRTTNAFHDNFGHKRKCEQSVLDNAVVTIE